MTRGNRKASAAPRPVHGQAWALAAAFLLQGAGSGHARAQAAAPSLLAEGAVHFTLRAAAPTELPAERAGAASAILSRATHLPEAPLPEAPLPDASSIAAAHAALGAGARTSAPKSGSGLEPSKADPGSTAAAAAQATQGPQAPGTAILTGVVSDIRGGLIANAAIKLESKDGAISRTSSSDAAGRYTFPDVPAGSYTVTISSPGLETIVLSDMPVSAGDKFEVPEVPLPVARTKADVEVFAGQEQVAAEQLHIQEQQRVLGVFPNFYTSFIWDAAPLNRKQKFNLMFHSTLDPVQFGTVAIIAGVGQATNRFPAYGQGVEGYAKRYGAAYADSFIGRFLGSAVFPSIFGQDPRYFYQGTGGVGSRAWHAISSSIICRGDSGHRQLHYSHLLGNFSAGALSNLYHPDRDRGIGLTVGNAVIGLGGSSAVNLVREFVLKGFTTKVPGYANGKPSNSTLKQ